MSAVVSSGSWKRLAGHLDCSHYRVELIILDVDATAERGLEHLCVGGRRRSPTYRVQECILPARFVESRECRQRHHVVDLRAGLQLPDDLQFFAQRVVLDGGERDQMLGFAVVKEWGCGERTANDIGHQVAPMAYLYKLTLFGDIVCRRVGHHANRSA
jgi:hypothetical protein